MRMRCVLALTVAVFAVIAAACGADDTREAIPARGGEFVEGVFDDLPRPPRTAPLGERTAEEDVVSQSFEVRNMSSRQVLDFYVDNLDEWETTGVENIGAGTYRGTWTTEDHELIVSSTSAPTLSEDDEARAQLSLSLRSA